MSPAVADAAAAPSAANASPLNNRVIGDTSALMALRETTFWRFSRKASLQGRPALAPELTKRPFSSRSRPAASRTASRPAVLFLNDTASTEIYTLSLHDALPI